MIHGSASGSLTRIGRARRCGVNGSAPGNGTRPLPVTLSLPGLSPRQVGNLVRCTAARGRAHRAAAPGHCTFVFLLCTIGIHLPSGPCISILKVYVVGDSSSMVTRDLNDWPPIVPSSV
jgi:hypothetical protein